jgi:molecular chaperone IbpA
MRMIDFSPLAGSWIGFDRTFDLLQNAMLGNRTDDAGPPYNIMRTGEDSYRIALAVAGFQPSDLSITVEPERLIVEGARPESVSGEYLHRGISAQPFQRRFALAEHVVVKDAWMDTGLLMIDLIRDVPEEAKPRRIPITSNDQPLLADRRAA